MTSTDIARRPDVMVEHYVGEFAQVLPSHIRPESFARLAVGALRRNPKLYAAASQDPASLMQCLLEAARLGLEPGTKEYPLIPRNIKGKPTVTGFPGWEGYVELMYRAGAVASVKAELVREGDVFRYKPGEMDRPEHEIDWFGERGKVLGAYAYAEMVGGALSRVVVIGPDEIARAKAASAGSDRPDSPWVTDFGAMVLKTTMRQLQKWVPTSAEYRREQLRAAVEVARTADAPPPVAEVVAVTSALHDTEVPGVMVDDDGVLWEPDAPEAS